MTLCRYFVLVMLSSLAANTPRYIEDLGDLSELLKKCLLVSPVAAVPV